MLRHIVLVALIVAPAARPGFSQGEADVPRGPVDWKLAAGQFVSIPLEDEAVDGFTVRLPDSYEAGTPYPLLLSLHSSGQVGGPVTEALFDGPGSALTRLSGPEWETLRRDFVIVSPHLSEGDYAERQWFDRLETLDSILLEVARRVPIDLSRIYIVGYSTGGTGVWGFASRRPHLFAAAIPIAGYTRPDGGIKKPIVQDWKNLAELPIWAFYNVSDRAVGYSHARNGIAAVEATGGESFKVLLCEMIGPEFEGFAIVSTPSSDILGRKRILSNYRIGIHSIGRLWDNPILYDWLLSHSNSEYRSGSLYRAFAGEK